MPATESDRLLAAGASIEVDGDRLPVRFSMLALKRCEDAYGSLRGVVAELGWLTEQAVSGWPEPVADRLGRLLVAVAGDDRAADTLSGPAESVEALLAAWEQAFPLPDEGKAEGATPTPPSPGRTGGGSPSSSAV
jgi:hypothetical protein